MATAAELQVRDRIFIGGEWVEPAGAEPIEVVNPTTEEVDRDDPGLLGSGRRPRGATPPARPSRAGRRPPARSAPAIITAIAAGLNERSEEIAATITQELGMPLKLSRIIQVGLPASQFASMPQLMEEIAWEEEIGNSRVLREPVGVLGAITPWNYPLNQIAAKVAPALAAGCTVVLKPSEVTPLNAFLLAEVIEAAGLPAGVFNLVTGARAGGRRGDRRPSRRRHGLLHRLDPGRAPGLRAGRGDGQAGGDGARRQVAEPDPRRRRPREGGPRRRRQVLPQLRPDLQRPDPDAGPAPAPGRGRGAGQGDGRDLHPRRPLRQRHPARARSSPASSASASAATSRRA